LEAGGGYPYGFPAIPATFREQEERSGPFFGLSLFFIVCAGRSRDLVSGRTDGSPPNEIADYHVGTGKNDDQHPDFGRMMEAEVKMLVDFHLEDIEVCTAVQRGLYAIRCQRGRLSHLEMSVWLFQRYWLPEPEELGQLWIVRQRQVNGKVDETSGEVISD